MAVHNRLRQNYGRKDRPLNMRRSFLIGQSNTSARPILYGPSYDPGSFQYDCADFRDTCIRREPHSYNREWPFWAFLPPPSGAAVRS
jgi:hypothetical protein